MNKYPYLKVFSKYIKMHESTLIHAFEIESRYHNLINNEIDIEHRKKLYSEMYSEVHKLYRSNSSYMLNEIFTRKAKLFQREVSEKTILDVGCGKGAFLLTLEKLGHQNSLWGIDISIPDSVKNSNVNIKFIDSDIIEFDLQTKFDVVYSNHVIEHMSDFDLPLHFSSLIRHLNHNGKLIINMPNRLFGPNDVTRIVDFSNTNRLKSLGSHFNEMSYAELLEILKKFGFTKFKSPIPNLYLKYLFPWVRINSTLIAKLEKNSYFLGFLYSIRPFRRCLLAYEVSIVAEF
jgi:2-polyprenyl-3-methyl-5-hydroxy-6-metoxy-1,4-benzoquinol methylase